MTADERAIRDLVATWLDATARGDLATTLSLMADDVVFMVPGQEPFGKDAFAATSKRMTGVKIEGKNEILEITVVNDWAWMRQHLHVTITPANGKMSVRSGYTLTILRKQADGKWVLARDANLLVPESSVPSA